MSGRWRVERLDATAAQIHGRPLEAVRTATVCRAVSPALVLGSAQPCRDVDRRAADAAGVEVVRRRSGGGAVLVDGDVVWVDLVVPAGDPLWQADVGRAMWWVGDVWAAALASLDVGAGAGPGATGAPALTVHRGAMRQTAWSKQVCFAGVGAGEVLAGDRKIVGISQRRTRDLALFQCALLLRWRPRSLLGLLALDAAESAEALAAVAPAAVGVADLGPGAAVRADEFERALLDALP